MSNVSQSTVMLRAFVNSVIELNVIWISYVMQSAVMLRVVMLSVKMPDVLLMR
jgi:hypothetical protein